MTINYTLINNEDNYAYVFNDDYKTIYDCANSTPNVNPYYTNENTNPYGKGVSNNVNTQRMNVNDILRSDSVNTSVSALNDNSDVNNNPCEACKTSMKYWLITMLFFAIATCIGICIVFKYKRS